MVETAANMATLTISLNSLPEEICLEIVQHTPHSSYPSLARVSKRFAALVVPQLYRAVYYCKRDYSLDRENFAQRHSRSEICSLSLFSNSIRRSRLASLIKQASFEWNLNVDAVDSKVMFDVRELLPPSLEQLHLSSTWRIPKTLDGTSLITSLDIASSVLQTSSQVPEIVRDRLYLIFRLPRLDRLSIVWQNSETTMIYTPDFTDRTYTSNVTSLSFYAAQPLGNHFAEILSWPKQLKSLNMLMRCKGIPQSWNNELWKDVGVFDVVEALQTHTRNLEELCISGESVTYDRHVDLLRFTVLRRFDIPQGDRMFYRQPGGHSSILTLSPSLEVLRIDFRYRRAWTASLVHQTKPLEEPIFVWLSDIALNASKHPKLSELILDNIDGDEFIFNRHLARLTTALLHTFERTGIKLTLSRT